MKQAKLTSKSIFLYIALAAVLVYLVFFFNIDITHNRILQQFWNFGHIILYMGIFRILTLRYLNKSGFNFAIQLLLVVLVAALTGSLIELIQSYTGRDKSQYDVVLDVVGGLIGYAFSSRLISEYSRQIKVIIFSQLAILFIISLYPMGRIIFDDIQQYLSFPIILSNLHSSELSRFKKSNIRLELVTNTFTEVSGNKLLKIDFKTGQFSSAEMGTFIPDWSGYRTLKFKVFNPSKEMFKLNLRINDSSHYLTGNDFRDRYNHPIYLKTGWNTVTVQLEQVKNAPANRNMQMDKIDHLIIFAANLKASKVAYFSQMRLSP